MAKLNEKKWLNDIKEITDSVKRFSKKDLISHYVAAMMNWEASLDQRDQVQKKLDTLQKKFSELKKRKTTSRICSYCGNDITEGGITEK